MPGPRWRRWRGRRPPAAGKQLLYLDLRGGDTGRLCPPKALTSLENARES
jgi:hypothetical protein